MPGENNLLQIVVQEEGIQKRSLVQWGSNTYQVENQIEVVYDDLTMEEKVVYDSFVEMLRVK